MGNIERFVPSGAQDIAGQHVCYALRQVLAGGDALFHDFCEKVQADSEGDSVSCWSGCPGHMAPEIRPPSKPSPPPPPQSHFPLTNI